jgi:hypothetical protein
VPSIEVEGAGTFDVEEGKRLVLAIEEDAGADILHDDGPKPENWQGILFQSRGH